MTDPLSITASVTGLLVVGTKLSHAIFQIINGTRSAPAAIHSLGKELVGLCKVLGNLAAIMRNNPSPLKKSFPTDELGELLENIMEDFKGLQVIVNEYKFNSADGILRQRWKVFLWGFQQRDVEDLRRNIEAYKATLNLTLTVASLSGVSNTSNATDQIYDKVTKLETELQELRALCQELKDRSVTPPAFSLRRMTSRGSTSSLSRHPIARKASNTSTLRGSAASTYRAASFIEYYCNEIDAIRTKPMDEHTDPPKAPPVESLPPLTSAIASTYDTQSIKQAPDITGARLIRVQSMRVSWRPKELPLDPNGTANDYVRTSISLDTSRKFLYNYSEFDEIYARYKDFKNLLPIEHRRESYGHLRRGWIKINSFE